MNITISNNQTFGAKLINTASVVKLTPPENKYTKRWISFVQIFPEHEPDLEALGNAVKSWENDKFARNAYYVAGEIKNQNIRYAAHKIYALTSQAGNYETLDPEKILGIAHVAPFDKDHILLEHLQVKPSYIYNTNPEYKGIGTAIIKSLQNLCNKISLTSSKEKSVKNFYKKNGFMEIMPDVNAFTWTKDIFDR